MRLTPAGKVPGQSDGIGHPNIIFEKDYRGVDGWSVRVETTVPVKNDDQVRKWLDSGQASDIRPLLDSLILQTPDKGDLVGARHMVAAALGFELGPDGKAVEPRPFSKPLPAEKEVRPDAR